MKLLSIVGHFGFGKELLNGQTIKTKILTAELQRQFGADAVGTVDTHGGKKNVWRYPWLLGKALRQSRNLLILPAHNGLRIIVPLLAIENLLFHRKLHYAVIGGWLPTFLQKHRTVRFFLKRFHGIYVETNTMKTALEAMGFSNIYVLPNCKELPILLPEMMPAPSCEPYKLCTFSRVMREKGMEDAIAAVKQVNERYGRTVYTLTLYGQIEAAQADWFAALQAAFPPYVTYGGVVPFDKSVDVLQHYFALLFPTRFYTEGIPGTVIDAYAAGLPVIASRWQNYEDLLDDAVGFGYSFGQVEELVDILCQLADEPQLLYEKKVACLERATRYLPREALRPLLDQLKEQEK